MPPAASDEPSYQNSQSFADQSPLSQDPNRPNPEHESTGKSKKKGKKESKGKDKAAKQAVRPQHEDLLEPEPPLKPEPSSCPNPSFNIPMDNALGSPVLGALGSLGVTQESDTAYRTDTWTKSIPFGKSPPCDPIDSDFANGSPFSLPSHVERAGGFSHPSSASSPPARRARPLSYGNGYLSSGLSRQQSTDRQKSRSLNSPYQNPIPLPHMPQAHFHGAPEIDLPLISAPNRTAAEEAYSFCAFDRISSSSFKTSRMGGSVLLTGTDGGLEVLAIEDRKTRPIGQLSGLNGRVVEAKILDWGVLDGPLSSSTPHVAVVIHGPCARNEVGGGAPSSAGSENNEAPSIRGAPLDKVSDDAVYYQTRAEIYSLRTGGHITTLFTSKPVPCYENIPGMPVFAPPPVGNLKFYASSNHLVLASGVSGEVYIYGISPSSASNVYRCLGKTWTSIQSRESRRYSTSSSSTDPDGSQNDSPNSARGSENPILSLRGRWLATVPPSATYRASLHGSVPASLVHGKIYGLETRSPPSRPAVTCTTDLGEGESFFNKMARGVTQELVRGARWMGDQGLQAWNNYWNKDQPQSQSTAFRRPSYAPDMSQQGYSPFPPTHAQDTQAASPVEPDLVSIIDLRKLEDGAEAKNAFINPVVSFQAPNGCSFLSFSPSGLMLLTASRKGDVQYVWDLMQSKHCRTGAFITADESSAPGPNVRQVARYARLTTSTIVDVIWTAPLGDRLAIITRKGTVHVFDMPRSAFQWPPFRRSRPIVRKPHTIDTPTDEVSERTNSPNPLSAAIKLMGGTTQPIIAAVRGRAPSTGSAFPSVGGFGITSAAGVRGGKAVAAGLSKSVGAAAGTMNTLRHVGENRLHLSGLSRDPAVSRVTWFSSKGQVFLGLVDQGFFRMYSVVYTVSNQRSRLYHSVIGTKGAEIKLPAYMQSSCGPMHISTFNPHTTVSASLALPSSIQHPSAAAKTRCQPLSQAEIETNAPFQPFHTDQRVSLHVLSSSSESHRSVDHDPPSEQWVFGGEIAMSKIHVRPFSPTDDEGDHHSPDAGFGEMENLISLGNSTSNVEEVVITTRRKKRSSARFSPSAQADIDDGFFENDCEVLDFARDRV
ncbi:hypothetical protein ASPZODRAFT_131513 [Penicilliopsis zonata CBS 506.65]|uniref:BCAS3 domain-containing protein n=1 Tax=Penicilliopsis zonata CBS 506.65 TaxID=1073090 RepID=A0A1L9SL50_9EURO|nr:hypothetical protein ASPZODRAFT_131513 [Penicilliopsis zonata CBS 506.65]OJJ47908.1 hypothetical protein ASPZODRAFT_131513 [Penicilliopsis zonata CBS 506.65]